MKFSNKKTIHVEKFDHHHYPICLFHHGFFVEERKWRKWKETSASFGIQLYEVSYCRTKASLLNKIDDLVIEENILCDVENCWKPFFKDHVSKIFFTTVANIV